MNDSDKEDFAEMEEFELSPEFQDTFIKTSRKFIEKNNPELDEFMKKIQKK